MIAKRIIPCLDILDGCVVKGQKFQGVRPVADPVEMARLYNQAGADELVFYDIGASVEGRELFWDTLEQVASEVFIPLTVGGGIRSLDDIGRALKSGADKVSINSGAIVRPEIISEAAAKYGSQCVVLSVDVKKVGAAYHIFAKGGREDTGIEAIGWIERGVRLGAGEVVVNSIDTDGVRQGFDLPLLKDVAARIDVPIIASGGAGKIADFAELFQIAGIDAGLAAGIFHSRQVEIGDLKRELRELGINMRI